VIYFPHIPKAGGTTLKRIINRNIGKENCMGLWEKQRGADFSPDEFPNLGVPIIEKHMAIYGHLDMATALANKTIAAYFNKGELLVISAVRDPIDRIVSLFNYMTVKKRHPRFQRTIARGNEGFVSFCKERESNFQHRFLRTSDTESTNDIFENVIVFALADSINGFSTGLHMFSGLRETPYEKTNVTSDLVEGDLKLYSRNDLPRDTINELIEKNTLDYELLHKSERDYETSIQRLKDWGGSNPDFLNKISSKRYSLLQSFLNIHDFDPASGTLLPARLVNEFRDMAVRFENMGDIRAAELLMSQAFKARPHGPFIRKKMAIYRHLINR